MGGGDGLVASFKLFAFVDGVTDAVRIGQHPVDRVHGHRAFGYRAAEGSSAQTEVFVGIDHVFEGVVGRGVLEFEQLTGNLHLRILVGLIGGYVDYKRIRPSQTLLDPENPRLEDGTSNDREAINRLLAEGYSQMLALARDLSDRGEGNPAELPILVRDGAKYVVLEGNRRFAVLKLIGDPRLADDATQRAAFERIKKNGHPPPKWLYSAIAKDRDDADYWITLRHTGANDGVGVRGWSSGQSARHRQRMRAPIDSGTLRSIAIADELTEAYQSDVELTDLIKKVRTEKLTNIGRLFSGVTLTRMQFVMKQPTERGSQTLWTKHNAEQLHRYFAWAFAYLDEHSVDAYKNDPARGNLLNEHGHVLPDATDSMAEYIRLADHPFSLPDDDSADNEDEFNADDEIDESSESDGDGESPDDGGSNGSSPGDTDESGDIGDKNESRKRDRKDERSIYSGVRLPNLSPSIQRLLKEAKQLPIKDNYAIACVLARVILELSVSDPKVLAWSGKKEGDKLPEKIRGCIFKLDSLIDTPKRTRQDLVQANLETNEIGVVYLHQFMHNPSAKSDPHLARRFSAAYSPLLNSINEAVN